MPNNPQAHQRKSIRLKGYDYTQPGAYFVTLATQDRERLFGEIVDGALRLNAAGRIVESEWRRLAARFPNLRLDALVVMPNHVHGILVITENANVGATQPSSNQTRNIENGSPIPQSQIASLQFVGAIQPPANQTCNVGATQPSSNQTCNIENGSPIPQPSSNQTRNIENGSPIPETRAVERMDGATRAPENHSPERMVGSPLPDGPAAQSLGAFIGQFKSRVTKRLHLTGSIWQRNYYEHIIRNEAEWERIRQYIQTNPLRWEQDDEYTPV